MALSAPAGLGVDSLSISIRSLGFEEDSQSGLQRSQILQYLP